MLPVEELVVTGPGVDGPTAKVTTFVHGVVARPTKNYAIVDTIRATLLRVAHVMCVRALTELVLLLGEIAKH